MPRAKIEKTPEIVEEILEGLAASLKSVRDTLAERPDWPNDRTFHRWIAADNALAVEYEVCKKRRAELLVYDALKISDDAPIADDKAANARINKANLQVRTRLRMASSLDPDWSERRAAEKRDAPKSLAMLFKEASEQMDGRGKPVPKRRRRPPPLEDAAELLN